MKFKLAQQTRLPQVSLLMTAAAASVGLVILSWLVPATAWVVYPIQLFSTFVHESSHALAAFLTGNAVTSLTVSPDGSGVVWTRSSGISSLFISSAGYLGTTAFGIVLLAWLRFELSSRIALYILSGLTVLLTLGFGLIAPFLNFLANITFLSLVFTVVSGLLLATGLASIARFASQKWVNFALAFLAIQCLLNSFFALRDLFFISATGAGGSDAENMAAATGIPSLVWVFLWTVISIVMLGVGIRLYGFGRSATSDDSLFDV